MMLVSAVQGAVRDLVLTTLPHGGQRVARRNAWASMSADAAMARARREAEAALARATAQSSAQAALQAPAQVPAAR
jgi:hypothetical protein